SQTRATERMRTARHERARGVPPMSMVQTVVALPIPDADGRAAQTPRAKPAPKCRRFSVIVEMCTGHRTSELPPNHCHNFDLFLSTDRRTLVHVVHGERIA